MKTLRLAIEGLRIALSSLKAHKLRTLLTLLGVAIGIFAITIIFTLVNSLNHNVNRSLSSLGNTVLYVYHWPWTSEGFEWHKFIGREKVSYNDFLKLENQLNNIDGICYEVRMSGLNLKYRDNSVSGPHLRGITEDFIRINNMEIESGRPFTGIEVDAGRPVVILGANVAEKLFEGNSGEGSTIRMEGKNVHVAGILKKSGAGTFGVSPDDMVLVPYGFSARIFNLRNRQVDKMITVRADGTRNLPFVENQVIGLMRSARGLRPRSENDFSINKPEMLMSIFGDVTRYLRIGGIVISIFSIIVGGFGIGNIMYATVKERSFEIGLQKSLGATRAFVLYQFLMEAILLCLAGGIVGLLLQFGLAWLIEVALAAMEINFEIIITLSSILTGLILSVIIGLVSGLVPSIFASRLDPVEAMRK